MGEDSEFPEDAEPPEEFVHLAGSDSLTVAEAHDAAAEYRSRVVLLAGEFESGKTTLIVELYARFLHGPFQNCTFGGSRTLIAVDKRHSPTRYASGNETPTTERTQPDHEGLLHLRLATEDRTISLFLSDMRGERFEHIVDGAPVTEQLSIASRADQTMIMVDGRKVADVTSRQQSIMRARLLIGGLTDAGGVKPGCPMAIVLTKRDLVDDAGRAWFDEQASALCAFAAERGSIPVVLHVAARPDAAPDDPECLDSVLNWLMAFDEAEAPPFASKQNADDRLFWQYAVAGNE